MQWQNCRVYMRYVLQLLGIWGGALTYSLFRNNWHPIFLRKQFVIFRKTVIFLHKSLWNALRIFIINFIFELAQAFKSFLKGQILENLRKKLWNLDNTSRSNPVNSCSYYSFRVPRKLYRKTSGRVATQSLSSVVNRILNDTQRSAGQFFLNRL